MRIRRERCVGYLSPGFRRVPRNLTSASPIILEELKKSLLPGAFSTNRRLIGQ